MPEYKITKNDLLISLFSFLNEKNILDDEKTDLISEPYLLHRDFLIHIFSNKEAIKKFLTNWLDDLKDTELYFINDKKEIVKNILDEFIITELYYLVLNENRKLRITFLDKLKDFFYYKILIHLKKNDVPF